MAKTKKLFFLKITVKIKKIKQFSCQRLRFWMFPTFTKIIWPFLSMKDKQLKLKETFQFLPCLQGFVFVIAHVRPAYIYIPPFSTMINDLIDVNESRSFAGLNSKKRMSISTGRLSLSSVSHKFPVIVPPGARFFKILYQLSIKVKTGGNMAKIISSKNNSKKSCRC